jgi:predicted oxidoreductase (fatty acid repression mutant protein)
MTLKEYLSAQHHNPEIQEKLDKLFRLPDRWRFEAEYNGPHTGKIECILSEELKEILE